MPPSTRITPPAISTRRRVAGQGALLFAGFSVAQGCSFIRNALLGHWLSKGDFGIAATITLSLQLIEILSDLATDRLIVQAEEAEQGRLMRAAHLIGVVRSVLIAVALWCLAPAIAAFFHVADAAWAFRAVALAPLLKGLVHLDYKRQQLHLDNRAAMAIEVAPQVAALAAAPLVLYLLPGYQAVVWLTVGAATITVTVSHVFARTPWRVGIDRAMLARIVAFGWPIWLSAFPLIAVFQGDRAIVGHYLGIEALAGYTAAFTITMVPALIASKVGFSLLLPLLSQVKADRGAFRLRLGLMAEATALLATGYVVLFVIVGGHILPLAFGKAYQGLGPLVAALAVMWGVRMLQAVPGTALMAMGETRPYLIAGLIRASAIGLALSAAVLGYDVVAIAAAGTVGEILSYEYINWRLARTRDERGRPLAASGGLVLLVGSLAALLVARHVPAAGLAHGLALAAATMAGLVVVAAVLLRHSRTAALELARDRRARLRGTAQPMARLAEDASPVIPPA